tara:strand:- start:14789 stop:15391 length:603 start_codon:yes stop_codon:yes gene_type:complete
MELVKDVKTIYQDYNVIRGILRKGYSSLDVIVRVCNERNILGSRKKIYELISKGQIEKKEVGTNKEFPVYKYFVVSEKPSYIAALGVEQLGVHQSKRKVKKEGLTYEKLLRFISTFYGVSEKNILSKVRKRDFVICRQVFGRIALDNIPNTNLKNIGSFLGGRDHSTIIHGNTNVNNLNETDKRFNKEYNQLLSFIGNKL